MTMSISYINNYVQFSFRFEAKRKFFSRQVVAALLFSTKTIFFKAQRANRIFFSAHVRDRKFVSIKFAGRNPPPPQNHI